MTAHVYTWHATSSHGGRPEVSEHASLELSDGTYISWSFRSGSKDAILQQTFRTDVERQARKPDRTLALSVGCLDEGAVRGWWRRFWKEEMWRKQMPLVPTYTVFEALTIGLKGFGSGGEQAMHITNKILIDYIKRNKLTTTSRKCVIL